MRQYYLHDGSTEQGPYTLEELKTKSLTANTSVWYEGLSEWTTISKVEELQELFKPKPPVFSGFNPDQSLQSNSNDKIRLATIDDSQRKDSRKRPLSTGAIIGIVGGSLFLILLIAVFTKNNSKSENLGASLQQPVADSAQLNSTNSVSTEKPDLSQLQAAELERKKRNDELTQKNMQIRNNWQNYFRASTNNYRIGSFGGISDLTVYFDNLSDYTVDEMIVRVYYYKANGSLHGTNDATVYSLTSGERKSFRVPDTGRGTEVRIEIIKVYGSKFHFLFSSDYNSGNPADPYYYN